MSRKFLIVKQQFKLPRYITGADKIKYFKVGDKIEIDDKCMNYTYFKDCYRMLTRDLICYFHLK